MTPERDREVGAALERALPSPVPPHGARARVRRALQKDPRSLRPGPLRVWVVATLMACAAATVGFYAGIGRRVHEVAHPVDSVVSLGFARVLLRPGAWLDVERDDGPKTTVRLTSGTAFFHVKKGTGRAFEVVAGDSRVEVVGTVFAVSLTPPLDVHVEVAEGTVRVKTPSGEHTLTAGQSFPAGSTLFDDAAELSAVRAPVTEVTRPSAVPATAPTTTVVALDAGASAAAPERRRPLPEAQSPYAVAKQRELGGDREGALAAYRQLAAGQGAFAEDALFAVIRMHAERGEHGITLATIDDYRRRFAAGRYGRDVDVRSLDAHQALRDDAATRREADAFLAHFSTDPRAWRFRLARAALLFRAGDCTAALADLRGVPDGEAKTRLSKACEGR
jgi:hypothetical protein